MQRKINIIAIGSRALQEYGWNKEEKLKDIDIVVSKEDAFDLVTTVPCEKDGTQFFYKHVEEVKGDYPWSSSRKIKNKFLLDLAISQTKFCYRVLA